MDMINQERSRPDFMLDLTSADGIGDCMAIFFDEVGARRITCQQGQMYMSANANVQTTRCSQHIVYQLQGSILLLTREWLLDTRDHLLIDTYIY